MYLEIIIETVVVIRKNEISIVFTEINSESITLNISVMTNSSLQYTLLANPRETIWAYVGK